MDENIELTANFEVTTSILDLSEGERIKLYPNPNTGFFRLSYPSSGRIEHLMIFNSPGQLIWEREGEASGGQIEIDISDKGSGIYWTRFQYREEEYSLKFLKE